MRRTPQDSQSNDDKTGIDIRQEMESINIDVVPNGWFGSVDDDDDDGDKLLCTAIFQSIIEKK